MGIGNIDMLKYPKQGDLRQKVKVAFNYDRSVITTGTIVRNDIEEPYRVIIELIDGRYILDSECQYSYL
jgi:regulation of enolase protein 1 (concanavalin A-like superfamily)